MISAKDLVLVTIIPSPRDMEIARILGWYRIPFRKAPKVVAVDYLAFYQPASFGENKWQIEWVAAVHGHELATRDELLKEEPNHPRAREEYFKIQLGSLEQLAHPIKAGKWKRVTFLYTTGERLLHAGQISDLTVHDDERQILWKALRERALEKQNYKVEELPELAMDPEILALFTMMAKGHIMDVDDDDLSE